MSDIPKYSYFTDGKRKIDYVLVYSSDLNPETEEYKSLQSYLKNIENNGLQIEMEVEKVLDENVICAKIHAPNAVLDKFLEQFKIDLSCDNLNYKIQKPLTIFGVKCFQNRIMTITPEDPLFQRAPKTFSCEKPTDYTDTERILLVDKMLSQVKFSDKDGDIGYAALITGEVIRGAYPLHASPSKWTKEGPLSDRQILRKYWASLTCFYKQQPLNLIEKYYGSEVAFYFAWLGFYSFMLIPAAILALICCICGVILYAGQINVIVNEVCDSDQKLCPVCPRHDICGLEPLKNSCRMMKLSYLLDNPVTVVYSILMSFWGVTFSVLWKRRQAMLKLRWNLNEINVDNSIRPEYIKWAQVARISSMTGQIEYYASTFRNILGKACVFSGYFIMVTLYVAGIVIVMYVRLNILYFGKKSKNQEFKQNLSFLEALVSSILTIIIMTILDTLKHSMAKLMTKWQNPRTKVGYQRKFTTKLVILSLADVFFPIFYLAYFKGHFYAHPGDPTQWTFLGMIKSDVCNISGCLVDLAVQLFAILVTKNAIRLVKEILMPVVIVYCNKIIKTSTLERDMEPAQWENDFLLVQPKEGFLYSEYITMVIQYGFVTFFVVALPIAPILALINNIIELRMDAHKILLKYRRVVPKKVNGIEEWNVVVHLITVLGAISNPLLLAYSSTLIPKSIYLLRHSWSLKGFINSTLSEFNLKDYSLNRKARARYGPEVCQYYGKRYPPNHDQKYERTGDFWHELAFKTIFFVILENLCLLLSLLLSYTIPVVPRKVELKILEDQRILRETKLERSKSQSSLLRIKKDKSTFQPGRSK